MRQAAPVSIASSATPAARNAVRNAAGTALAKNPDLFGRRALTNAQRASQFSESLHQGGGSDAADEDDGAQPGITVVGETGTPKKKGAKTGGKLDKRSTKPLAPIDFRATCSRSRA